MRITMASALLLLPISHVQQPPAFRGGVDLVTVDVSVRERGKPVTGLTAGDFVVFDNGVVQDVVNVDYGTLPIDVTLALDIGLMNTALPANRVRQAVGDFMSRLAADDRIRLLMFNGVSTRSVDFTKDHAVIDRVLRGAAQGAGPGLTETLEVALASTSPTNRRQLIIFVTDGALGSSATPESLTVLTQRSRATLSIVMPRPVPERGSRIEPTMGQRDRTAGLWSLVSQTGGGMTLMTDNADLVRPLHRLLEEFQSTYLVHFTPRGVTPGGFHTLEVTVRRPGVMVKARRGYIRDEVRSTILREAL
jgi:VWFA-related protein